jgi:hypothetical protein
MDKKNGKSSLVRITALSLVILFTMMACSLGGVTLSKNAAVIDISLKQDQINQVFSQVENQNDSQDFLLKKITGVELHDGYLRVLGTYPRSDGSEARGSYDVSLTAQNDALKAQVTSVNIEGVSMNDPRIVSANQRMSEELSKSVSETNGDVLFKEATVTEGALKLKIQVNFKGTVTP